jgi:hypothetical protein
MPGPHGLQGVLILFLVCIRAGGWLLPGLRTRQGEATDAGSYEVTPGKLVGSGGDRRIVSRPAPPCHADNSVPTAAEGLRLSGRPKYRPDVLPRRPCREAIQRQRDRRRPSRFYGMATLAMKRSNWCNAPSGFWPLLLELSDQAG